MHGTTFLSDLTPDLCFFAVLVYGSLCSACFLCTPSWQPSSTVTRQHLRQLLLVPFLNFLLSLSLNKKDTDLCGLDLKFATPPSVEISLLRLPLATTKSHVLSIDSSFGPFRPARRCFFSSYHMHQLSLEPEDSFESLLHTCLRHTPSTKGVWLFMLASRLLPTRLRSSESSLLSARSTKRKHAILFRHSPMLGQFFLHCLGID